MYPLDQSQIIFFVFFSLYSNQIIYLFKCGETKIVNRISDSLKEKHQCVSLFCNSTQYSYTNRLTLL